jgi:hypothetical protein
MSKHVEIKERPGCWYAPCLPSFAGGAADPTKRVVLFAISIVEPNNREIFVAISVPISMKFALFAAQRLEKRFRVLRDRPNSFVITRGVLLVVSVAAFFLLIEGGKGVAISHCAPPTSPPTSAPPPLGADQTGTQPRRSDHPHDHRWRSRPIHPRGGRQSPP